MDWTSYCLSVCNASFIIVIYETLLCSILISIGKRIIGFSICVSLQFPLTSVFLLLQEYARKALDFIWEKRQRSSNLVGVTINIHTGDWVRKGAWYRDSGSGNTSGFGQEKSLDAPPAPKHLFRLFKNINEVGKWSYIIAALEKPALKGYFG